MANPGMVITVGANVAGAVAGLNQVGTAAASAGRGLNALAPAIAPNLQGLTLLGSASNTAAAGLGNVGGAAAAAGRSIGGLAPFTRPSLQGLTLIGSAASGAGTGLGAVPPAVNAAGAALSRVRPAANQAGTALSNVGRVAQDLPFGFIGIQNNLNPLLESFQRLRAETGSNRLAFRALGQSLLGAGGIGLALSVVSSAILIYQNGVAGFNKKTKEASDKAKEFVDSLKSVAEVAGEAGASVQGQIAQVQALAKVVTDTNNSNKERSRALTELKQINKAYFGDLKLEEGAMGSLTSKVNEYTQALVQQAVVKGFTDEITRVSKELFSQEKALTIAQNKYKQFRGELDKTKQSETSLTGEDRVSQRYLNIKDATEDAQKAFFTQRDVVEKLRTNYVELNGAIGEAVKKSLQFKGTDKETDLLKQRIAALKELQGISGLDTTQQILLVQLEVQLAQRDGLKLGFTPAEINQQVEGIIEKAFPVKTFEFKLDKIILEPQTVEVAPLVNVGAAILPSGISDGAFDGVIKAIRENAAIKLAGLQKDLATNISDTVVQGVAEGLASVGDTIGHAFGDAIFGGNIGETLAEGAEGLLKIVGSVLQDVGKQIIITSTLVAALKKALDGLFGPGGEIIAAGVGIALVGLGGLLKNIKIPAFANGVTGFSGGLAVVGERGAELVNLPRGADVIPNSRIGGVGQQSIVLVPSIKFSGADFRIMLNQADERKRQLG